MKIYNTDILSLISPKVLFKIEKLLPLLYFIPLYFFLKKALWNHFISSFKGSNNQNRERLESKSENSFIG